MPRILIVDDHPMVREAIASAVKAALRQAVILEAGSAGEACRAVQPRAPLDIILLDLLLPDVAGLDGLMAIRSHFPRVPILIFTALDDPKVAAQALALGAAGYLPKSAGKAILLEGISAIMRGGTYVPAPLAALIRCTPQQKPVSRDIASRVCSLTRCEIRVLQFVRRGLLNKQIAYELGVGETTVKAHVTSILRKLNVASRTQIVIETSHLDFDAILRNKAACEAGAKASADSCDTASG
jgi:DNA-binding NarL/FixJ family response regulator